MSGRASVCLNDFGMTILGLWTKCYKNEPEVQAQQQKRRRAPKTPPKKRKPKKPSRKPKKKMNKRKARKSFKKKAG